MSIQVGEVIHESELKKFKPLTKAEQAALRQGDKLVLLKNTTRVCVRVGHEYESAPSGLVVAFISPYSTGHADFNVARPTRAPLTQCERYENLALLPGNFTGLLAYGERSWETKETKETTEAIK